MMLIFEYDLYLVLLEGLWGWMILGRFWGFQRPNTTISALNRSVKMDCDSGFPPHGRQQGHQRPRDLFSRVYTRRNGSSSGNRHAEFWSDWT